MLRATALLLLLSTPATGQILDLRQRQVDDFRSIIDLRGVAGIAANEATPKAEPVASADAAAPIRMKSSSSAEAATETASQPKSSRTIHVAYVGQGDSKAQAAPKAPRRSFRIGRRR